MHSAADVTDFFNYVTGFGRPQRFRKILVAPFNLREGLIERIREVAEAAAAGKQARIRIKVNALSDPEISDELYAASQAGARVDLIARSVCVVRPGVKRFSENISVRSIVGRFLEHSRVYNFQMRGRSCWLIGSADLMPRNLDHRLEIMVPVEDPRAQRRLADVFDVLLADNGAWQLRSDGSWYAAARKEGEKPCGAQSVLMRRARRRAGYRGDGAKSGVQA